ncbi:MAG: RidA family protein [Rhodospirillales bacterium]
MLKLHVLDDLWQHSGKVAHGVEVPAGTRLLFTNGQVGTRPDGITPESTIDQTAVVFDRLRAILLASNMKFEDVVRLNIYLTEQSDVEDVLKIRDQNMGDHKPAATILVVNGLARPGLKVEIEAVAARISD